MRQHVKNFGLAALLTVSSGVSASHAQSVDTTGASRCEVRGYLADPDPEGTNVRAAPRGSAPIIGHLAPLTHLSPDDAVGVELEVTGSAKGWLLIRRPVQDDEAAGQTKPFRGIGWVSGTLVSTQLGATLLRSAPRRDAPVIMNLRNDKKGWGADSYKVTRIHACDGQFVEITAKPPEGPAIRGWSFHPCASQLTTCDRSGPEG